MAVVGKPQNANMQEVLRNYDHDPMRDLAKQFSEISRAGLTEGVEIFSEPRKFFMRSNLNNSMRNFFIKESFDREDPEYKGNPQAIKEAMDDLGRLYDNDVQGLCEAAPLSAFNPVVGITFPMHKNLLMTTVFDKGAIPKDVAAGPQFTLTMETRTLYSPDGTQIDMFLEQNKIKSIMESAVPRKDIVIAVPEDQQTDVLGLLGAVNRTTANVSRASRITKLIVKNVWTVAGEQYAVLDANGNITDIKTYDQQTGALKSKVIPIEPIRFVASYGQYDRTFQKRINMIVPTDGNGGVRTEEFQFSGSMHRNRFTFMANSPNVSHVVLSAALDVSSAAYETPKVKWSARTDFFEIPEAPHITVTISPEETRDIQAMYNVNQLTKLMSMIKLTLVNFKDDKILEDIDMSFLNLPKTSKVTGTFDFIPPDNFLGSHVTWRYETFMDYLDTQITTMLQVLNDENVTISIFGRPELIRKITPKEYSYVTPSNIGPVMLDYKKTVKTSDNRVYQFISSNKLRNDNNLIIILNPRNSNRIMYKIFDYQLYVGNEIRDTDNYQLPAVTAFERFLFISYQPVQGRIQILNPTGLKTQVENSAPIGLRAMNDYTANNVTYDRNTGKYVEYSLTDIPKTPRSVMNKMSESPGEFKGAVYGNNDYAYAPNYSTQDPSQPAHKNNTVGYWD